jgi:hypothetical protein
MNYSPTTFNLSALIDIFISAQNGNSSLLRQAKLALHFINKSSIDVVQLKVSSCCTMQHRKCHRRINMKGTIVRERENWVTQSFLPATITAQLYLIEPK